MAAGARRSLGLALLWTLLGLCGTALAAATATGAVPIRLAPDAALTLDLQPQALVDRGSVTITNAAAGQIDKLLAPASAGVVALGPDKELWMPLLLHNPSKLRQGWKLQVPNSSLDEVTLFELRGGRWSQGSSGDQVPRSVWSQPGRFPVFGIWLEPGETRSTFLRVRNVVATQVPVRLVGEASADAASMRAELGYGFVLGALALLTLASLTLAVIYRDANFFLYGIYALLLTCSAFSVSGLASQYVWGESTEWSNALQVVFPLAAAGVSVLLVRALCRVANRGQTMARVTAVLGGLVIALSVAIPLLRVAMPSLVAVGMLLSAGTVLATAIWTWRRGDSIGAWVLAAHAPLIGTTALILLRMFGIAPLAFDSGALVAVSVGVILVLLLVALVQRSREVLALHARNSGLSTIDPLTGLLAPSLFRDRVRAAENRYRKSRHDAAVLYVRLANYARIREQHGASVAEQSMIRAAMKLQRLMPDADCVGRVGESTLGLILETVTRRDALSERAARLVAHGLMPLPGLKPDVLLKLHVVGNVMSENPVAAADLQALLDRTLDSMSARTRRPIRFMEPVAAQHNSGLSAPDESPLADTPAATRTG